MSTSPSSYIQVPPRDSQKLLLFTRSMVQIYEQVVSDIENKDTHFNFLLWLKNSDHLTYIYNRKVLLEPFQQFHNSIE